MGGDKGGGVEGEGGGGEGEGQTTVTHPETRSPYGPPAVLVMVAEIVFVPTEK